MTAASRSARSARAPLGGVCPGGVLAAHAAVNVSHEMPGSSERAIVLDCLERLDRARREREKLVGVRVQIVEQSEVGQLDATT